MAYLQATIEIENALKRDSLTNDEKIEIDQMVENPKNSTVKIKSHGDVLSTCLGLIAKYCGFTDIERDAMENLKMVFKLKCATMAKQYCISQGRVEDSLCIPQKSALSLTYFLNGIYPFSSLPKWYTSTYLNRYNDAVAEWKRKREYISQN